MGGTTNNQNSMFQIGAPSLVPYLQTGGSDYRLKLDGSAAMWAMGANEVNRAATTVCNTILGAKNAGIVNNMIDAQETVATKYYDTQEKIAGYQQEVALKYMDVQETAIFAQERMHGKQTEHEQKMMKLENSARVKLAQVAEKGRTDRTKILSVQDAFSRRGYFMGNSMGF